MIAVGSKRKLSSYSWTATSTSLTGNFQFRKEMINLPESPRNIIFVSNGIIVGYKRSYESIDINTFISTKILDVDKDQKMLCLEVSFIISFTESYNQRN